MIQGILYLTQGVPSLASETSLSELLAKASSRQLENFVRDRISSNQDTHKQDLLILVVEDNLMNKSKAA